MKSKWQPWIQFQTKHPEMADRLSNAGSAIRPYLPPVNFITMHHAYFIFVGLIFAAIFWASSNPTHSVSFIDSLFLVESAFTSSGLNTVNISQLTTGQQIILALMMVLGSPVLISLFTIWFRAHIFEKRFQDIVDAERSRNMQTTGTIIGMAGAMFGTPVMSAFKKRPGAGKLARRGTWMHNRRAEADAFQLGPAKETGANTQLHPIREDEGLRFDTTSARPESGYSHTSRRRPFSAGEAGGAGLLQLGEEFDLHTFISRNKKNIGRNGQFFDLTDEQREYLGGVEYRSLRILFVIVAAYFFVFQILGAVTLGAWIAYRDADIAAVNAQNGWWAGVFLCISSFNNAGMTLLDAGIAAFDNDAFVLTVVTLLALGGNYAFPAFIRAMVFVIRWALGRTTDESEYKVEKEALDYILKYPRRLYMMMFPAKANWTFVGICTSLAALNWIMLLVLSIGNSVLETFPVGRRIGLALFQALTIPSGGYTVISASGLWFDVQVLWVVMMYVAAYPEIIVMRNSNVYEERSLGIYTSDTTATEDDSSSANTGTDTDALLSPQVLSPGHPPLTPHSIAPSHATATSRFSEKSIKKLSTVGRRSTAFVGRQIQKRVNNFHGVGVTPLRRAPVVEFDRITNEKQPVTTGAQLPAIAEEGHVSLVTQHLRGQLSHDIWSIAFALFLITIIETSHSLLDPAAYSVFNFLFEIVSGYTNIGLSMGLPGESFSFCGGWYTGSKVILVLMMIRGRHRGLPVALDHAVKLPGWDQRKMQQEDAEIRRSLGRTPLSLEAVREQ